LALFSRQQAVALDLGTVVVGAFDDAEVKQVLSLAANEQPLCLMPVGRSSTS
jgi:nitroreductase